MRPQPPSRQDLEAQARAFMQLQTSQEPLLPCSPYESILTDANGYTILTLDYSGCTEGSSGKIIFKYKYTQTTWAFDVAYDHFVSSFTDGSSNTYLTSINGTWAFSGTLDASGTAYTFSYKTGTGGLAVATTKNGAILASGTATMDTICAWKVTSPNPLVASFTVSGTWGYSGSFMTGIGQVGSGNFAFAIPTATPLVWNYDSTASANCAWPTSGLIKITNGSEALSFTFTSTCGQAILNPGNKTVNF